MKHFIMAFFACIFALPAMAQSNSEPLRLAVAGVTHGHLGEVVSRIKRGDFKVVGVSEKDERYLHNNDLTGKVPEKLFYKDLGKMLDETKPEVVVALSISVATVPIWPPGYSRARSLSACSLYCSSTSRTSIQRWMTMPPSL